MRQAFGICALSLIAIVSVAGASGSAAVYYRWQDPSDAKPTESQPAQASDGAPTTAANQQAEQNAKVAAEQLLTALDQLIPGKFPPDSPVPEGLRQVARALLNGNIDETKKLLDALRQDHPSLPPQQLLLAGIFFALNQNEPGHLALEQAALDQPDYPGVYTALARVSINQSWWASSGALLEQLRRSIDAGTWTEEQKKHFEVEYLDAMADTAIGQRRFDPAREHLSQLVELVPENASVWFRLADVDFRQDKIDSALANLTKARGADANLYPAELVLYQWTSRRSQSEDAQRWIEAAVGKYPDEKSTQLEYCRFLLEKGNLADAATWVAKAEKGNANRFLTRFLRGQIAFIRRAYQVSEADFRELTIQSPNDLGARNMLALCLAESDDGSKQQTALEIANGNFRVNPNSPQAASTLAWVLYRLGNTQQAKQILSQVTSLPSFPSDAAFYVATMLADEGQDEGAANLLKGALKAPGLCLYRKRAEENLVEIEKRLAAKKDGAEPSEPPEGDQR